MLTIKSSQHKRRQLFETGSKQPDLITRNNNGRRAALPGER